MKKISTPLSQPTAASNFSVHEVRTPKKQTLAFIRQFARVYHPINSLPGIVLN
jgi:hypothetical protein